MFVKEWPTGCNAGPTLKQHCFNVFCLLGNNLFIDLFIETYLYKVDIISSQAIFHMCPVEILLYEKQAFNYIIYNQGELYNTDKNT